MNCFEWHTRISDYLDGTLVGRLKADADQHLDTCKFCSNRYKHFRHILMAVSSQPRVQLPVSMRKSPLSFKLPKFDQIYERYHWRRVPWYLRKTTEGLALGFGIVFLVASAPKLRSLYEHRVVKKDSPFTFLQQASSTSLSGMAGIAGSSAPSAPRGSSASLPVSSGNGAAHVVSGSFDGAEEAGDDARSADQEGPSSSSAQIWRFNLKTDSPTELRARVSSSLNRLGITPQFAGASGEVVPGGIQFDLVLAQELAPRLKTELERLTPQHPQSGTETSGTQEGVTTTERFTWYKTRSKNSIPAGQSRVVIWISQI